MSDEIPKLGFPFGLGAEVYAMLEGLTDKQIVAVMFLVARNEMMPTGTFFGPEASDIDSQEELEQAYDCAKEIGELLNRRMEYVSTHDYAGPSYCKRGEDFVNHVRVEDADDYAAAFGGMTHQEACDHATSHLVHNDMLLLWMNGVQAYLRQRYKKEVAVTPKFAVNQNN